MVSNPFDFAVTVYVFNVVAGPPLMFFLLRVLNKKLLHWDDRRFLWLFMIVVYVQMVLSAVGLYIGLTEFRCPC